MELLALAIHQNSNINGITTGNTVLNISQLADNTLCYVKDMPSVKELLSIFENFKNLSDLKGNLNKTSATAIRKIIIIDKQINIKWQDLPIETLGIKITGNTKDHYMLNLHEKIVKMKNLLKIWKKRKLTLKGKVQVINSLGLSNLLYVCSIINTPTIVFKEVKKIIMNFIWENKPAKIAYNTLIQSVNEGGLGLTDLEIKSRALALKWIKRY